MLNKFCSLQLIYILSIKCYKDNFKETQLVIWRQTKERSTLIAKLNLANKLNTIIQEKSVLDLITICRLATAFLTSSGLEDLQYTHKGKRIYQTMCIVYSIKKHKEWSAIIIASLSRTHHWGWPDISTRIASCQPWYKIWVKTFKSFYFAICPYLLGIPILRWDNGCGEMNGKQYK